MHGFMCLSVLVCSFVASLKTGSSVFVCSFESRFILSR